MATINIYQVNGHSGTQAIKCNAKTNCMSNKAYDAIKESKARDNRLLNAS